MPGNTNLEGGRTAGSEAETPRQRHRWQLFRTAGVEQVVLRNGDDLAHLSELDQKLWMALSMPTRGIAFDPRTADLLDTDSDGHIRPPEVLAAVDWLGRVLHDPGLVLEEGESVPLSALCDPDLREGARWILDKLGKPEADHITLADVADQDRVFSATLFNGDGVVPPEAAGDPALRHDMETVLSVIVPAADRSGKPGIDRSGLASFLDQAAAFLAWSDRLASDPSIAPLGSADTMAAMAAVETVAAKVEDFFTRCRVAAYDARATQALNRQETDFRALAALDLHASSPEIAAFPLAAVEPGRALPLAGPVNPAWTEALADLATKAVHPLLGPDIDELEEEAWHTLTGRLAAYKAWIESKPQTPVEQLGRERLKDLTDGNLRGDIEALIARDLQKEKIAGRMAAIEKLVRFRMHLRELLTNFVNFADFYGDTWAVFQAGTLLLDTRACHLCIEVSDPAKHALLAAQSNAYLAYCDLTRMGGERKTIVAVITDGGADHLMVGRNGLFYDREGRDWDAAITRIVSHPISVREAFWLPYKKFVRLIEEQIARRAQAADAAATEKMSATAARIGEPQPAESRDAILPRKLDLGAIALIGTAIGGISALIGGLLQALFGLGFWIPLGLLGLVLLISGPSMLLASLKLRQRNLGPILDANGWATNTRARLNIPFGAALTEMPRRPAGSECLLDDPFAEKKRPWKALAVLLAAALLLAGLWWSGRLDRCLPGRLKRNPVAAVAEDAIALPAGERQAAETPHQGAAPP